MKQILCLILLLPAWLSMHAQVYIPIPIGGFNNDIIADAGNDAAAATTCVLDLSNYVLYSAAFAATNNIQGGMVNSGTIVNGNRTYQLSDYASTNALYLSAGGRAPNTNATGMLTLGTPGMYSRLSLLVFSTEGNATLNIVLKFTDGTIVSGGSYDVLDWFWGNGQVYSGVGRVTRQTAGPYSPDGLSTEPRFYPLDIFVDCANQSKYLEMVYVNFLSGSGANTRGVVLALSGVPYSPVAVTSSIATETCGAGNGSIALSATGGTYPLTYAWNTNPVQTNDTAVNLAGGNYIWTITDSNHCVTTWQGTVNRISALAVTASSSAPDICQGENVVLSAAATGGTAAGYTWTPGDITGENITVSPADTTRYIVKATDAFGCTVFDTVQVAVKPLPVAAFTVTPATVCLPAEQTVRFTGKAGNAATYNWNNFAGATVKRGNGAGPYTILFNQAGNYKLQLQVTENGCASATSMQDVNINNVLVAPVVTVAAVTVNSVTFSWQPVPGATGYRVSINGTLTANTVTTTTYTAANLSPGQTITIEVIALGAIACENSMVARTTGKTLPGQYYIPNSFTPNGDGLNDVFKVYGNIIANVKMKIFNQWGELLYEANGPSEGWDGRQRGKLQPVGVYAYVIQLTLTDGTVLTKKGMLHLIH